MRQRNDTASRLILRPPQQLRQLGEANPAKAATATDKPVNGWGFRRDQCWPDESAAGGHWAWCKLSRSLLVRSMCKRPFSQIRYPRN